ncbi:MAG TPA: SDR family oxidoreductase [Chloroflexia bacterium]|nr:SDR family oxidoreductase [Chloroflexia bacterium]
MQLKPIEEQVVVLMGASSGIGRESAIEFARRGAKVLVAGRGEEDLASLVREITEAGGSASYALADVTDFSQVQAAAARAVELYGRLDTWVHLAAVSIYAPFEKIRPKEFKQVLDVNLLGQIHGALAALPYLRQAGGGSLVHIASVEGKRAFPFQSAYSASKHGIVAFTESLRLELRKEGAPINVVTILPGSINTPLFNKVISRIGVKPLPPPPIYQPNVVADAVLYAASHPAREIIPGGGAKMLIINQRLSPSLTDLMLLFYGFRGQKTSEPRSENAPNNLYRHLPGLGRVHGDFGKLATPRSYNNWLEKHPLLRMGAWMGAGLGLSTLLRNSRNSNKSRSLLKVK